MITTPTTPPSPEDVVPVGAKPVYDYPLTQRQDDKDATVRGTGPPELRDGLQGGHPIRGGIRPPTSAQSSGLCSRIQAQTRYPPPISRRPASTNNAPMISSRSILYRVEDGKFVYFWGLEDSLNRMRQLGLSPRGEVSSVP